MPTIGRDSLDRTLKSLLDQTVPDWEALVVPDAANFHPREDSPALDRITDPRIRLVVSPKAAGSAGLLRNAGIKGARGRWIAFVDDDDHLTPQYIEHLAEHHADYPQYDVIVFRMNDPKLGILPNPDLPRIAKGHIGISFAVHAPLMIEHEFLREDPRIEHHEDWAMISGLRDSGAQIYLSPHIDYLVRGE